MLLPISLKYTPTPTNSRLKTTINKSYLPCNSTQDCLILLRIPSPSFRFSTLSSFRFPLSWPGIRALTPRRLRTWTSQKDGVSVLAQYSRSSWRGLESRSDAKLRLSCFASSPGRCWSSRWIDAPTAAVTWLRVACHPWSVMWKRALYNRNLSDAHTQFTHSNSRPIDERILPGMEASPYSEAFPHLERRSSLPQSHSSRRFSMRLWRCRCSSP